MGRLSSELTNDELLMMKKALADETAAMIIEMDELKKTKKAKCDLIIEIDQMLQKRLPPNPIPPKKIG